VRYGFRPNALWRYEQAELRRQLRALINWECQENGTEGRFVSWQQEQRFGLPGSSWRALELKDQAGTDFQVHGIIDRLDRDDAGRVRVIDYKSGSTPFYQSDIRAGLALQTALYALAVEGLSPDHQVMESAFLHIPTRKLSGRLSFAGAVAEEETVQQANETAARFVRQARAGVFPTLPGKPQRGGTACAQTCDLAGLCRVTRHAMAKARRLEQP
jgi:ATP-dependent helicase/DNAse subunit B